MITRAQLLGTIVASADDAMPNLRSHGYGTRMGLHQLQRTIFRVAWLWATLGSLVSCSLHFEQRDAVAPRRASYNDAFFSRHNREYRTSAAIHIAHAEQHDALVFNPLALAASTDEKYTQRWLEYVYSPPRFEPEMMDYAQHTGQAMWKLYLAIDWTHAHHEQTYDILSDTNVTWSRKARVTQEAVEYYLSKQPGIARSPAPLDVTMRRAGIMMKPYFGVYRSNYPHSARFFYAAHWWHPAIYEAMMLGGSDNEQDAAVEATEALFYSQVLKALPSRMLLSRELMPRYSRMSPESANIFDNLHMLHGIAYAILSYDQWSIDEQRAEMYRVIDAMSEKPGDRELARLFEIKHANMDPRRYEDWMKGYEGAMNEIMEGMLREMWPMMSPDGSPQVPEPVMEQLRKKLRPGLEAGEVPGSLHDALMNIVPNMKMTPESMEAKKTGKSNPKMVDMMLMHWRQKVKSLVPVDPWPMQSDPSLASIAPAATTPAITAEPSR